MSGVTDLLIGVLSTHWTNILGLNAHCDQHRGFARALPARVVAVTLNQVPTSHALSLQGLGLEVKNYFSASANRSKAACNFGSLATIRLALRVLRTLAICS